MKDSKSDSDFGPLQETITNADRIVYDFSEVDLITAGLSPNDPATSMALGRGETSLLLGIIFSFNFSCIFFAPVYLLTCNPFQWNSSRLRRHEIGRPLMLRGRVPERKKTMPATSSERTEDQVRSPSPISPPFQRMKKQGFRNPIDPSVIPAELDVQIIGVLAPRPLFPEVHSFERWIFLINFLGAILLCE